MKELNIYIRKNGFNYELVKRGKKAFIYKQYIINWEGKKCDIAFEVFKLKIIPKSVVFGNTVKAHEHFPSNSDFGLSTWAYHGFLEASYKFNELENVKLKTRKLNLPE